MGGTFDPVHNGHLALAEAAQKQMGLREVLWVPAGQPWRKGDQDIAATEHRVAMVRLAIETEPTFRLSRTEAERTGPTYTIETLAELQRERAGEELCLILGQDAIEDLSKWKEPGRILQMATLAVAIRRAERQSSEDLETLLAGLSRRVVWLDMPLIDVSATAIRRRAAAGQSLQGLVPDGVAAYIREHGLYQDR